MTDRLTELLNEWDEDATIDRTRLGDESLKGMKLHAKWLRYRANEKLRLRKRQTELAELKRDKHEFYLLGPTKETQQLGWEMPARGAVLKSDIGTYMDADKQIIEKTLEVAYQNQIVEAIDLIFEALKGRGFDIQRKLTDLMREQGN